MDLFSAIKKPPFL